MPIIVKPTKITSGWGYCGFYLRVPKTLVDLFGLRDNAKYILKIDKRKKILQYIEVINKTKHRTVKRKTRRRTVKRKTRRTTVRFQKLRRSRK